MRNIEIYVDPNGRLSLRQFSSNGNRCELTLRNEDVYYYLNEISDIQIEQVIPLKKGSNVLSIGITSDKYNIKLVNLQKLERYEEFLTPITKKVEKKFEEDKIKKMKSNRTTKPKVTRKNKHSNSKVKIAGMLLAGIVLVGGVSHFISLNSSGKAMEPIDNTYIEEIIKETEANIIEENINNDKQNIEHLALKHESIPIIKNEMVNMEGEINNEIPEIEVNYENRRNTDKANYVISEYGHIITKYANMYGIDPNLMIAIATQERGVHSSLMDPGGATGLMQMQNAVWKGNEISAYNFETGTSDTYTVTQNMIEGLETNIQMGCMYFQNCLDYMDYNIPAAIQCYNMGITNMKNILNAYANEQGISRQEVLSNPVDTGWIKYRYLSVGGDENYLENVVSWLGNSTNISVSNRHSDTNVELTISNSNAIKQI